MGFGDNRKSCPNLPVRDLVRTSKYLVNTSRCNSSSHQIQLRVEDRCKSSHHQIQPRVEVSSWCHQIQLRVEVSRWCSHQIQLRVEVSRWCHQIQLRVEVSRWCCKTSHQIQLRVEDSRCQASQLGKEDWLQHQLQASQTEAVCQMMLFSHVS